ncbi:MAG: alpha/beta hydrolase [Actinomycetota bacterium]|nr:alpha/beta hydrolase [Actinomycetota bacterium]
MGIGARVIGSGEHKVIVVHDWFGTAESWGSFLDYLDGSQFTYAFIDVRGYGSRKDVEGEYTLEEIATDVLALADELGWQTFSLVGHSMGGKAVQRVLGDASDRVTKLVGLTPVPAAKYPMPDEQFGAFAASAQTPQIRRALLDTLTGKRAHGVWLDRMVQHSIDTSKPEAYGKYLQSWVHTDFVADIHGNETPIKVIVGEHDPATPAALIEATWLKFYPNAQLEVLANAGHYPMYETPVALAGAIESFLKD